MAQLEGADTLLKMLRQFKRGGAKKALRKGTRKGCKTIQAAIKAAAPVRSGTLRDEARVRAMPRSRKWTGTMVTLKAREGRAYYGSFVELGTKRQKAQHYEKQATLSVADQAVETVLAEVRAELEKTFR